MRYRVTDDDGTVVTDRFIIVVSAAGQALALPGTADQTATVGVAFSLTLPAATGGATPYAYTVSGQSAGLTFNATSRVLSGTPTTAGTDTITYEVTDDDGDSESDTFDIVVSAAPPSTGISVFDAAVVGGDTDPNVSDATPGVPAFGVANVRERFELIPLTARIVARRVDARRTHPAVVM